MTMTMTSPPASALALALACKCSGERRRGGAWRGQTLSPGGQWTLGGSTTTHCSPPYTTVLWQIACSGVQYTITLTLSLCHCTHNENWANRSVGKLEELWYKTRLIYNHLKHWSSYNVIQDMFHSWSTIIVNTDHHIISRDHLALCFSVYTGVVWVLGWLCTNIQQGSWI